MCNATEKKAINHLNRIMVGALATFGMVFDSSYMADIACLLSVLMWLALPEYGALVEHLWDNVRHKVNTNRS